MNDNILKLQSMVDECNSIVFFGGAGVSTESGIPDFRSVDGLYNQKYDYPPETMLSHTFYIRHKEEFFKFYRDKLICTSAKPNKAHLKLAEMEQKGKLSAVVTQNIDGLHQMAGSKNVFELHGSTLRNYCEKCGKFYSLNDILTMSNVPKCSCGGDIKPDVVLYEEGLNDNTVRGAIRSISNADMLIIGGTSLTVYPASSFIDYFNGKYIVLINRDSISADRIANLVIHDKIGEVLSQIKI